MIEGLLVFFVYCILFFYLGFLLLKQLRKNSSPSAVVAEYIFWILYFFSFLYFLYNTLGQYYEEAIDPIDQHYEAFSSNHIVTLIVFLICFLVSSALLHLKGKKLPPLMYVLRMVCVIIGICISCVVIIQIYNRQGNAILYPILNVIISVRILLQMLKEEINNSLHREYRNPVLNFLNKLLRYGRFQWGWTLLLLFPVFGIIQRWLSLYVLEIGMGIKSLSIDS